MSDAKRTIQLDEIRQRLDKARVDLVEIGEARRQVITLLNVSSSAKLFVVQAIDNRRAALRETIDDCNKLIAYAEQERTAERQEEVGIIYLGGVRLDAVANLGLRQPSTVTEGENDANPFH